MQTISEPTNPRHLLDAFPLIRSRSTGEARELVGRALSPHQLHVRSGARDFEARHNQIRLDQMAINVLSYGAEVEIDPGERGDFYLMQLPLQGRARLRCNGQEAWVDPDVMSVLHPRTQTRMLWSGDCAMILLQVPSQVLQERAALADQHDASAPRFSFTRSRHDPEVAAWWQTVGDVTRNLHQHGAQWLRHPAAFAAIGDFLLAGLDLLRPEAGRARLVLEAPLQADRRLRRAVEYIHAHASERLTLTAIASAACASPRALEAAFRRRYDDSPLAYARGVRLDRVHDSLKQAAAQGGTASVTELALQQGFIHMGRFAHYYRMRFGCPPSTTLRGR